MAVSGALCSGVLAAFNLLALATTEPRCREQIWKRTVSLEKDRI